MKLEVVRGSITTILSFIAVMTMLWNVGKPHAEDFINETVKERIDGIETRLDGAISQQKVLIDKVDSAATVAEENTKLLKKILERQR